MTACNMQISSSVQSVPTSKRSGNDKHFFRRYPTAHPHIACIESRIDESKKVLQSGRSNCSSVLCNLRRSYASRGKSIRRAAHTLTKAEKKYDGTICSNVDAFHASVKETQLSNDPEVSPFAIFWNVANGRQTVCPLKLSRETNKTSKDDNQYLTDDLSVDESRVSQGYVRESANRSGKVRFNYYVKVVEIPHRHTFTKKQRVQLWNSSKVIREMARRNRIEYCWEGPEWQKALEEDQFCEVNGVWMHPAHLAK